jgi:diguanylate cyclase (GGDEF)-like protein
MEQEIRRSDRMGRGFTMLMLDLDDLKPVNDTYGHQWGDRLLKAIADTIRQTVRFTDAAARYGGDEFVVLLPETDAAGGYVVGEKLRRDIAAITLHAADRNVRSSVSVGLVSYPDDGTTIEQLVAAADVAMYESKRRGKNRIVGYQTRTERVATAIDAADAAGLVQLTPTADVRTGGDPVPWGGRSEPSAITIEPGTPAPPPWSTGAPTPTPRPPSSSGPTASEGPEPPTAQRRSEPPPDDPGPPRSTEVGLLEQPWLTRTDGATAPPPPRAQGEAPGGERDRASRRADEIRANEERPWIALPIEPDEPPDRSAGKRG